MLAIVHHHHEPCRQVHGARYCSAIEQRHAIRTLRSVELRQEERAGRPHRVYRVTWNLPALRRRNARLRARIEWLRTLPTQRPATVAGAVCALWHPCSAALAVFRCESGLSTTATNGQYLGFAQMGAYARGRYGHGSTPWEQAVAAFHYYQDAGWSPWECARIVGMI